MKPGTYTQIYIHVVFAVKNRDALLNEDIKTRVFEYIAGIVSSSDQKAIIVNGTSNHVHILFGLIPSKSISETVHMIKRSSSLWINKENLIKKKFAWQEGYGAFSYSRTQLDNVYKYILNQEEHHKKTTFKDEYVQFLKNFEIEFDEKFLFEFFPEG